MITIRVSLYRSAFHGLRDTGEPDWPPSPKRLFGALLAGAYALDPNDPVRTLALSTLHRMAATRPPIIDVPAALPLGLPATYAPKTWLPEKKNVTGIEDYLDLSILGMDTKNRALKHLDGVGLSGKEIEFHIDLECNTDEIGALNAAASRLAYFGTAKDTADITVSVSEANVEGDSGGACDTADSQPSARERWYPSSDYGGDTQGWQENTIEWYEANYQRVFGQDPTITQLPPIPATGFVSMLHYSRQRVSVGAQALSVVPLRRSVLNHRIPALLADLCKVLEADSSEYHLMPLTVSHESVRRAAGGDGRCVGIAVVRKDVANGETGVANDGTVRDEAAEAEQVRLVVSKVSAVVESLPESDGLIVGSSSALRSPTWVGSAKRWYSTTPLRAFPDKRVARFELESELRHRFDTETVEVVLSRSPHIKRNGLWAEAEYTDGLTQWWAEIVLPHHTEGPIQLGAATERGFGVFRMGDET